MKSFGIDISRHNGNGGFDLSRAKQEGVKFAILKAGGGDDGLYKDAAFEKYYSQAKALGIPVGAYWFSRATTVEGIIEEANYFFKILDGKKFELPVYIDVENKNQLAVGKDTLTELIKAFCDHMEGHGCWVGIYSSLYYFREKMYDDQLQKYAHWVAQWNEELGYNGTCGMWQFGGETNRIRSNRVAGMVCDQNYMLEDYPAEIKAAGLNGFGVNPHPAIPAVHRGDVVRVKDGARDLNSGSKLASWVYKSDLYVKQADGSRVVLTTHSDLSGVTAAVRINDIV